jgi:hypothetical protein
LPEYQVPTSGRLTIPKDIKNRLYTATHIQKDGRTVLEETELAYYENTATTTTHRKPLPKK